MTVQNDSPSLLKTGTETEKIIFDYTVATKEHIACNACGYNDFFLLAQTSRDGTSTRTCLCRQCGLIYINPRMTPEEYDRYYDKFYHADRARINEDDMNASLDHLFTTSRRFGCALAHKFRRFIGLGLTIDVGSGVGGVLSGIRDEILGIEPFGIEPSGPDTNYALKKGIPCATSLFEEYDDSDGRTATTILCTKSLNHLLDPRKFFEWAFAHLSPGGYLILAVKNFRHQCRRAGSVVAGIQIDHVFMFTPEVLQPFVESVGFRIVHAENDENKSARERSTQRNTGLSVGHIWIVAERPTTGAMKSGFVRPNPRIYRLLRTQFWHPFLALYYYIFYSHRLGPLRRFWNGAASFIKREYT